jgi:hypothetical protein
MLFAVCAALYYCLARTFRRGLTRANAVSIGALTAIGLLTKLNFLGFAPGVLLGLPVLAIRTRRRSSGQQRFSKRAVSTSFAIALLIALAPILVDALSGQIFNHSGLTSATPNVNNAGQSPFHEISYIWQLYLPHLPGMPNYFSGISTTRQLWFNGLVGLYGWDVVPFPNWVYNLALVPFAIMAALALRELVRRRGRLLGRVPEAIVYCLTGLGLLFTVGVQSYTSNVLDHGEVYDEPRYLLPMLALWGLLVALAVRGAGRRWASVATILLVALFLTHDILSQLQVVARFYG